MKVTLVVAHTRNRVIGRDNQMPWHLPADLAYFKQATLGKPIIMGRKTFASIGRPLPGRRNIVITRDPQFQAEGVIVVHGVQQALAAAGDVDEVMVIGGSQIYQSFMPLATGAHTTLIDTEIDGDAFFPELPANWLLQQEQIREADERNAYVLKFQYWQQPSG